MRWRGFPFTARPSATIKETKMSRCFITVEFTRDLHKDKLAGINTRSSLALEGVIRRDYDLEELTVSDIKMLLPSRYRVTAELPIYPEQGDSVTTLLTYKMLHLQNQALKGKASPDFVVVSISLSEDTYQASDVFNRINEDRTLSFSRLQVALEDGVNATKGWLSNIVLMENKNTGVVIKRIDNLLALMEPSLQLEDGAKPSGKDNLSVSDLAVRDTLYAHAPKIMETVTDQWLTFSGREIRQELGLVRERLKRLNHLHLSLPHNYELDGADVEALVEKFSTSDEASITEQVLRNLLDEHDPDTSEGRAFRKGLLVASQLAMEHAQGRKDAASIERLHHGLTASFGPEDEDVIETAASMR